MTTDGLGSPSELPKRVDTVVVGGGLMGAATMWHLGRRGMEALLIEQYEPANSRGSSHGSARITRRAYVEDDYVRLTGEAFEWWHELELQTGSELLVMTGGLDHGSAHHPGAIAEALGRAALPHELLSDKEAAERFPGMVFDGPVLYHPQAGSVDAERGVHAFLQAAQFFGGQLVSRTRVTALEIHEDQVTVRSTAGDVSARTAVIAAGGWVQGLVSDVLPLPPIRVTEHRVFHFPRRDTTITWPVTIHNDTLAVYHLPGGRDAGAGNGRKVAQHTGLLTTANTRRGIVDPQSRRRIVDYVERWLPGLEPTPYAETTCLYTSTPSTDFLIDRLGPLVLVSACSGHGAKMAPTVGRLAADLVAGNEQQVSRFRFGAHPVAESRNSTALIPPGGGS